MKLFLSIGLIACNWLLSGCHSDDSCQSDDGLEAKLKAAILAAKPDSKESLIDFNQLADFDWDELLIITPYALVDSLPKEGVKSDCLVQTHMEHRDNLCVLAFLKNEQLVRYITYPRWPGDFAGIRTHLGYKRLSRQKTQFFVTSTNQKTAAGKPFLLMEQIP